MKIIIQLRILACEIIRLSIMVMSMYIILYILMVYPDSQVFDFGHFMAKSAFKFSKEFAPYTGLNNHYRSTIKNNEILYYLFFPIDRISEKYCIWYLSKFYYFLEGIIFLIPLCYVFINHKIYSVMEIKNFIIIFISTILLYVIEIIVWCRLFLLDRFYSTTNIIVICAIGLFLIIVFSLIVKFVNRKLYFLFFPLICIIFYGFIRMIIEIYQWSIGYNII
jgi:hypothetical protein